MNMVVITPFWISLVYLLLYFWHSSNSEADASEYMRDEDTFILWKEPQRRLTSTQDSSMWYKGNIDIAFASELQENLEEMFPHY